MRNLLSLLPNFKTALKAKTEIAVPARWDHDKAALFYNTLVLLIPDQKLMDTAFDDYYPSVYLAIKDLNDSHLFFSGFEKIKENLKSALDNKDMTRFEEILDENAEAFSVLKFLMTLQGGAYKGMSTLIFTKPEQPIFEDLQTNTRFGKWYHNEGVQELLQTIEEIEGRTGVHFDPEFKKPVLPMPDGLRLGN